jgi:hypothetical protein
MPSRLAPDIEINGGHVVGSAPPPHSIGRGRGLGPSGVYDQSDPVHGGLL